MPCLSLIHICFQHLEVRDLTHPALLRYLQGRVINIGLAKRECKELHFTHNGKPFFAIGFPNMAGGYEVRNSFCKGCIAPKDITHIRQQGEPREKWLVFEGFMDYLSFLTLRMKNCPTMMPSSCLGSLMRAFIGGYINCIGWKAVSYTPLKLRFFSAAISFVVFPSAISLRIFFSVCVSR